MKRHNRGITLVELLVAFAISTAVMGAIFQAHHLSHRSADLADGASRLHTALLVEADILARVHRLFALTAAPLRLRGARRLSFTAVDPAASGAALVFQAVTYHLDRPGTLLIREEDGRRETVGAMPLESIEFAVSDGPAGMLLRVTLRAAGADLGDRPHTFVVRVPREHARGGPAVR